MRPHRLRTVAGGERSLLAGIQYDELRIRTCAEHVEEVLRAVICKGQDGGGDSRADVLCRARDLDVAVFIERTHTHFGENDVRCILCDMNGIYLPLRAIRQKSVELVVDGVLRDVENAVVVVAHRHGFGELGEQTFHAVQFLIIRCGILRAALTYIDGTRPDGRLCRDGFDVVVKVSAEDEIHTAPLCNRHNISVVERIRVGMVCDEDAPRRPPCILTPKILLHP